jgi:hypothetical protein
MQMCTLEEHRSYTFFPSFQFFADFLQILHKMCGREEYVRISAGISKQSVGG